VTSTAWRLGQSQIQVETLSLVHDASFSFNVVVSRRAFAWNKDGRKGLVRAESDDGDDR
jgi:hypothetical protein